MKTRTSPWSRFVEGSETSSRALLKLSALLVLGLPACLQAQLTYSTTDGTITITGYNGTAGPVTIPDAMFGAPITRIGDSAFKSNPSLTSVTIGNNVTYLGFNAFASCINLTNVTIGNGLTRVEDEAFRQCTSLTHVTIGSSVTLIRPFAFYFCTALTSLTIPNSVQRIESSAFDTCIALTNLTFGSDLLVIGTNAFYQCGGLTRVAIPNNVRDIEASAFESCGNLTSVTFGNSVARIGNRSFRDCPNLMGLYFKGNPPQPVGDSFLGDNHAVAYYLPGATGWSSTFYGLPSVLWDPAVQIDASNFGVRTNRFGFSLIGTSSLVAVVEACTNLANPTWSPVATNTLAGPTMAGSSYFTDPQWTNSGARFYRLRSP